nr:hypothetical protein 4 [Gammaproteobacteria bacterium]
MILRIETKRFTLEIDPSVWSLDTSKYSHMLRRMKDKNDLYYPMESQVIFGCWEYLKEERGCCLELV